MQRHFDIETLTVYENRINVFCICIAFLLEFQAEESVLTPRNQFEKGRAVLNEIEA